MCHNFWQRDKMLKMFHHNLIIVHYQISSLYFTRFGCKVSAVVLQQKHHKSVSFQTLMSDIDLLLGYVNFNLLNILQKKVNMWIFHGKIQPKSSSCFIDLDFTEAEAAGERFSSCRGAILSFGSTVQSCETVASCWCWQAGRRVHRWLTTAEETCRLCKH